QPRAVAWSNDGKRLAVAGQSGQLELLDEALQPVGETIVTIGPANILNGEGAQSIYLSWSANDTKLAVSWSGFPVTADGGAVIWDIATGRQTPIPFSRTFFVGNSTLYGNSQVVTITGPAATFGPIEAFLVQLTDDDSVD